MNKVYGILVVCFLWAVTLNAQVSVSTVKGTTFGQSIHGLGFSGGAASGLGISYRYHTEGNSSFQGVVGVFKPKTTDTFYSFGLEYQHDLTRSNSARFYFGGASCYVYNGSGINNYAAPFRAGVGLGGEFLLQDAVHFNFEGLFTYFSDGSILPLPQLAIHYYFY